MDSDQQEINMSKKRVHLVILLDKSGSMARDFQATRDGVREYVESQQDDDSTICTVSLYTFNNNLSKDVKMIHVNNFPMDILSGCEARGSTRLFDSLVDVIQETEENVEKSIVPPELINVLIVTDGLDMCSKHYTAESCKNLIKAKKEKKWIFNYIGRGESAFNQHKDLGIGLEFSNQYGNNTADVWKMSGEKMKAARSLVSNEANFEQVQMCSSYTDKDREVLKDDK